MKSPSEKYYAIVYGNSGGIFVVEAEDIDAIIVAIQAAREQQFRVRVSPNTHLKLRELQREATRGLN